MFSKRIYVLVIVIAILVSAYALAGQAPAPAPGARGQAPAAAAAPPFGARQGVLGQPVSDPWPGKKKLLAVADVQSGHHHDSISHALATVERLGRESGAYVTVLRTDSQLITYQGVAPQGKYLTGRVNNGVATGQGTGINVKPLQFYDAIFMLPSGDGTMTYQQREDLLRFIRDDGKGLIVGHAAGVAFTTGDAKLTWPEWGDLIGGLMDRVDGHSGEFSANARIIVEDTQFPGAMSFGGATFMLNEQHPVLMPPYSRNKVRVIMRLDPASLTPEQRALRADGDFPVVWARQYGKGRVFNTGWGHPEETWDNPGFQKMMLEGIKWALGSTPADVTPKPLPK